MNFLSRASGSGSLLLQIAKPFASGELCVGGVERAGHPFVVVLLVRRVNVIWVLAALLLLSEAWPLGEFTESCGSQKTKVS